MLGILSNDKPSAIFKLQHLRSSESAPMSVSNSTEEMMLDDGEKPSNGLAAVLGILIEPTSTLSAVYLHK
jgi:hypothetical protein